MSEMIPCPFCGCTSIGTYSKPFNDVQSISHLIYCECNGCGVRTKGVKAIEVEDETDFWTVNEEKSKIAKDRWNNRTGDATTKINIQDAKIVAEIMRIGRVVDELKLHNNIIVQEHNQPNDYDSYVITTIKKYEGKNMTLAEIYDKDAKWLNWVAENYKPKSEKTLKDVTAIRAFVESKKSLGINFNI